jgi:RNA polymerase sigma-70 factor, ECF subfamily
MSDWDAIVGQHGPLVWRIAYRLLGNHADAGDCFQETFLSAWLASRRRGVENWGGFLQTLATARALDRLRQRLRRAGRGGGGQLGDGAMVACPVPGPAEQAEAQELSDQLRHALASLPPKQGEAFCLHYLEEWSYQEIGRHLGIGSNAVGALLHRARARLRETLDSVATGHER